MMRKVLVTCLSLLLTTVEVFAQETLQTVTDRGSTTTNAVAIAPISNLGSRMSIYGHGSGYFDIYNNSNNSISLALKRSDGLNVFTLDGHSLTAYFAGKVGIGTVSPGEKLSVNGKIRAHEIKVEAANWPDYVFEKDYQLRSLYETEEFIKRSGHLPGMPSAREIEASGVELGEMNRKLLEKIEELTLHLIRQERKIEDLSGKIELMESVK